MGKVTKIERSAATVPARKRVAAYARASRETERLMHSISAQISYYSAFIQRNPAWEYAGVYADFGISGTGTVQRSEFRRMLADCEAGRIDMILTKSISRFARNTVDLLETVRRLKALGIEVWFEKENIRSLSADGELMLSLLASFAQEESRSISENSKWGIRKRFQSGEIGVANKHLLGYQYDEEQKKYVILPEEARAVRWMFQMYIEGLPFRKIAEILNRAGVRSVLGNELQEGSVRQMIFNEVYAGDIRRQKCYMADPIKKSKLINRGELPQYYMTDCHEAIIDRETYAKVQAEMQLRESLRNPTYCFTGKLRCDLCGAYYARKKGVVKGKTYVHWICRSKKETGTTCTSVNFREGTLEEICAQVLEDRSFDPESFERQVKEITVLENGSLRFHLIGGETRLWEAPPKQIKQIKQKPPATRPQRPKNLFDGKIFCGQCGRHFGRSISQTKDGGHLYWYCRAKSESGVTCDSVNYPDAELREILCTVLGWREFDEGQFTETVERMIIQPTGSVDIALRDGSVKHYETLKLRSNLHQRTTSTEAFQGKIRCVCCGNLYHKSCFHEKYVYWHCGGKERVRTECTALNIADYNLRRISAYIMETTEFDEEMFISQIKEVAALPDGSLEYHFTDGRTKTWRKT